jgi:hypothetical protein
MQRSVRDHEYKRHGTVTLMAGIDLLTGQVHAFVKDRHRSREFIEFLNMLQISEFPTGDFGSNRQAVSVETDRPYRSKAAPRCEWVLVPALANRRCVIHPILLWPAKASTLVINIVSNDCCGRL